MLTDEGDLVVDFFGGSNTTGMVAERLGRRWFSCDLDASYVAASSLRLIDDLVDARALGQGLRDSGMRAEFR